MTRQAIDFAAPAKQRSGKGPRTRRQVVARRERLETDRRPTTTPTRPGQRERREQR